MIEINKEKCLRCGGCVAVCPKSALTLTEHGLLVDSRCINCGKCVAFCPVQALRIKYGKI
jgi:ferredoxin